MNKIANFFIEKAIPFLIQYTIGLLFPWWLIDAINRMLISGYGSMSLQYPKWERYTICLVLPWWILTAQSNKKMQVSKSNKSQSKPSENQKKRSLVSDNEYEVTFYITDNVGGGSGRIEKRRMQVDRGVYGKAQGMGSRKELDSWSQMHFPAANTAKVSSIRKV